MQDKTFELGTNINIYRESHTTILSAHSRLLNLDIGTNIQTQLDPEFLLEIHLVNHG